MAISYVDLKVSEEITAGQEVADTYTPANGAEVWLEFFQGDAAFTPNSAIMVVWDYNGAGETIVWSTKGNESFNTQTEITGADGTKKVAVVCANGETGALILSGLAKIKVKV